MTRDVLVLLAVAALPLCACSSNAPQGSATTADLPAQVPALEPVAEATDFVPPTPETTFRARPEPKTTGSTDPGSRYATNNRPFGHIAVETDPLTGITATTTTGFPAPVTSPTARTPESAPAPAPAAKKAGGAGRIRSSADLPPPGAQRR